MDCLIHADRISMELPILYFEGSQIVMHFCHEDLTLKQLIDYTDYRFSVYTIKIVSDIRYTRSRGYKTFFMLNSSI